MFTYYVLQSNALKPHSKGPGKIVRFKQVCGLEKIQLSVLTNAHNAFFYPNIQSIINQYIVSK